jgi:hypothetical protein
MTDLGASRAGTTRRVLYLRTFRDPAADVVVLGHLATALGPDDRIVLLGDVRDESVLLLACDGRGELVTTTATEWPGAVHVAMVSADAVVLHLSPKDMTFPRISRPPDLTHRYPHDGGEEAIRGFMELREESFLRTPLGRLPTGAGLLREIAYLDRLGRLDRTVAVADNRHFLHVCRRVQEAVLSGGEASTVDGLHITARLTVLERQLRLLREVPGVTFSAPPNGGRSDSFTRALRTAVAQAYGGRDPVSSQEREVAVAGLPLGRSPRPRPMFPDGELKVLAHTAAEELVELPTGEVVEIAVDDARRFLTAEVAATGCPTCLGPLNRVFFYAHGLDAMDRSADLAAVEIYGRCQTCGRRCTVWSEGRLAAF